MAYTNPAIEMAQRSVRQSRSRRSALSALLDELGSYSPQNAPAGGGMPSPGGGSYGGPTARTGGGSLDSWISAALRSQGIRDTPQAHQAERLLAMRESGGRNVTQQVSDINSRLGRRARGPDQVIPPTFAAYRDPRLANNVDDPVANIAASIRYRLARYHTLITPGLASALRGGKYSGY